MGEKQKKKKQERKSGGKAKIILSVMLLTILLMVELYIMINDSGNYVNLGIILVVMLVFVYLLTTTILEQKKTGEEKNEEQYENIFKAEKASYLQLRKQHTDVEKHLINLEQNLKMPKDEIVGIQKAIAKITINRSKENADALMNSNDMLMQKLFDFEDLLEESNNRLVEKQKETFEGYVKQILEKQSELEEILKKVEDATKQKENEKLVESIPEEEIAESAVEPEEVIEPIVETAEEAVELSPEPEATVELASEGPEEDKEASIKSAEQAMDELLRAVSEPVNHAQSEIMPEPEAMVESAIEPEVTPEPAENLDPNRKMTAEEIAALFDNV